MTELMLSTTDRQYDMGKYIVWRPIGSVIVAISPARMRLKWIEIVCDLVSPRKRETYTMLPGFAYLVDHWTEQLREEWLDRSRPTDKFPFGELNQNPTAAQAMWDEVVSPSLITYCGKEPLGHEDITNTWLWSQMERRKNYLVVVNETDPNVVSVYEGKNDSLVAGEVVSHPKAQIKWDTSLGLTQKRIDEILSNDVAVHPDFLNPIDTTHINTPNVAEAQR